MSGATKEWRLYKSEEARSRLIGAYEDALATWKEATGTELESLRVPTSAGETAVFAFGPIASSEPPLLLIHGTLSNSAMWMADAAELSRGRRVFAIDIPGEPGLSEERRLPWESESAASWLAQVVAGLGLVRFGLVGLSLGGWISLAYAIGRPVGLAALALLCPSGIGRARSSFIVKGIAASLRGERGLDALARSLYGKREPPPGALEAGKLLMKCANARMEMPRIYTDEELGRIAVPLFLAVGTDDMLLRSRESAARLGRLKPEATILLLPGAGHALIGMGGSVAEFFDREARA
jgi:pimeloyl-ACP methyl ester carboxylesterase